MSAQTQSDLERMTVSALKALLKPSGEKPARLKKDLVQQVLALDALTLDGPAPVGAHSAERVALREIFIDIWNRDDKNGTAIREMFAQFFVDLEDTITMEGISGEDVAFFARDLIASQL